MHAPARSCSFASAAVFLLALDVAAGSCAPATSTIASALLRGKTFATPFTSGSICGTNYMTISAAGDSLYNNIIAMAGTTCLPVVMEQCVTTVDYRSATGLYNIYYTQVASFGRNPVGCIALRANSSSAGVVTAFSTQLASTQMCPPDVLGAETPSTSTWTTVATAGSCPATGATDPGCLVPTVDRDPSNANSTSLSRASLDAVAAATDIGAGVGGGIAALLLAIVITAALGRFEAVAEFLGLAAPAPLVSKGSKSASCVSSSTNSVAAEGSALLEIAAGAGAGVGGGAAGTPAMAAYLAAPLELSIPARSMTLLLAPPRGGTTALLHALCADAHLAATDAHLPTLMVKETLEFAAATPAAAADVALALGLSECWGTRIGSDEVRGISGGQRRRVSLAETLLALPAPCATAPLVTLDGATTGLDATSSVAVIAHVKELVVSARGGSVVAALLQPTPEVVELFDHVVLLRRGVVAWAGPPARLVAAVEAATGRRCPLQVEVAEFAVSALGGDVWDGAAAAALAGAAVEAAAAVAAVGSVNGPRASALSSAVSCPAPRTASAPSRVTPLSRLLLRQIKLVLRDGAVLGPLVGHLVTASLIGGLLAALFPNPLLTSFNLRLAVVLFACFSLAFLNLPLVATFAAQRRVAARQVGARAYSAYAFAATALGAQLPVAALECALLSAAIYHGCGFVDDRGRFAFFYLCMLLADVAMISLYLLLALALPSAEAAQALAVPLTGLALLFSGFLATRKQIPDWLTPLYFGSPFSWMLQSIAINEFSGPQYAVQPPKTVPTYGTIFLNVFEFHVESEWAWGGVGFNAAFAIVATIIAGAMLGIAVQSRAFGPASFLGKLNGLLMAALRARWSVAVHTPVSAGAPQPPPPVIDGAVDDGSLIFTDVSYTIPLARVAPVSAFVAAAVRLIFSPCAVRHAKPSPIVSPTPGTRSLLRGISGRFSAGTLTAVLGASGAGKSTLLDVLLGLKTVGAARGQAVFRGESIALSDARGGLLRRARVAYVQQQDLHEPTATVREAIAFAATLRCGADGAATAAATAAWALGALALSGVADVAIGALAVGELKRLTIAVELAARPALLLLDEPTSGLDSAEALRVVSLLRDLAARTGTVIVAAIHAPSSEVYALFDHAIFLAPGGFAVHAGPVGSEGEGFGALLTAAAGALGVPAPRPLAPGHNAASWVLDSVDALARATSPAAAGAALAAANEVAATARGGSPVTIAATVTAPARPNIAARPPLFAQLGALLLRALRASVRDRFHQPARFVMLVIVSSFFGALFVGLKRDSAGAIQTALAVWWMSLSLVGLIVFSTSLPAAFRGRAVAAREAASGMYAPSAAAAVGLVVEAPWVLACAAVSAGIIAPLVATPGVPLAASMTGTFAAAMVLIALVYTSLAHAVATASPTLGSAQAAGFLLQALFLLFGGLLLPAPAMPAGARWLMTIDPLKHAADAVWASQFFCAPSVSSSLASAVRCRTFPQDDLGTVEEWTFLAGWLGLPSQTLDPSTELLNLLPFIAVFVAATALASHVSWVKR